MLALVIVSLALLTHPRSPAFMRHKSAGILSIKNRTELRDSRIVRLIVVGGPPTTPASSTPSSVGDTNHHAEKRRRTFLSRIHHRHVLLLFLHRGVIIVDTIGRRRDVQIMEYKKINNEGKETAVSSYDGEGFGWIAFGG